MQKNAAVLTIVCILLCLALNYTFPLHRDSTKCSTTISSNSDYANNTLHWNGLINHNRFVERSKKMAIDIENALRKIKHSAQDIARNIYHENGNKKDNKISEKDLEQYEQLVIMKKYPYLDLKELELNHQYATNLKTRQSMLSAPEAYFRSDPSFYEPEELNVEIINRGLSGFSIPPKLTKTASIVDSKFKVKKINDDAENNSVKLSKKSPLIETLDSLEKDILEYELNKKKSE